MTRLHARIAGRTRRKTALLVPMGRRELFKRHLLGFGWRGCTDHSTGGFGQEDVSSGDTEFAPGSRVARMLIAMSWTNSWTSSWIGWALLSAVFAAATALLAKVGVAHVDSNLATALRTSVVVVFAWGIVLALGKPRRDPRARSAYDSLPHAFWIGDRIVMAMLLPRAAAWACLTRGAAG